LKTCIILGNSKRGYLPKNNKMEAFLQETQKGKKFELVIDVQIFSKDIILKTSLSFLRR
jgi:hypothetical protein